MKRSAQLLVFVALLAVAGARLHGLDRNGNQLSDVWESHYSIEENADPASDWDGDGQTLAREALFGTDPRDPNSLARMSVRYGPIAGTLTLGVYTQAGKRYRIESGGDLIDWHLLGGEFVGDGTEMDALGIALDSFSPTRQFFRATYVGEDDADGDGLGAWEEGVLGLDDGDDDFDGDGLKDGFEVGNRLDPRDDGSIDVKNGADGDPDNDGMSNADEQANGLDPNDDGGGDPDQSPTGDPDEDGETTRDEVNGFHTDPLSHDVFVRMPVDEGFPFSPHNSGENPAPWTFYDETLSADEYPDVPDGASVFVHFQSLFSGEWADEWAVDDEFLVNGQPVVNLGDGTTIFDITTFWNTGGDKTAAAKSTIYGDAFLEPYRIVYLLPFEVAIDSDNNNGFDPPRRTQAEREARGELGNDEKPGKVLLLNDGDLDGDGIPDYADGYDLDDGITEDNTSENVRFVPVILNLTALDWQNAKVKFQYPASDPAQVTASADNPCVLPTEGKIRLWKKDGGETRNKDPLDEEGDFIKAATEYTMEQLGLSQEETEITLYVEAVKLSDQTADIEIKVEFDPSGTMGFDKVTDAVRLTATRVEILARGANETNFSVSDRLVASTLQLEPGDEQVTLDPFLLVAPIGGGTGDAAETQNGYSLSSQSTGIGGTADQFEMVYYVGNGDFDIHARLASFGNTVTSSKAGLMVRDNTGEGAIFGMVAVNGSSNYIFEYRDESGEASQTISGGIAAANPWLRLTRQGGTVRAYTSTDGQSWQQIGNGAALSFAPDSLIGMCLSSGSATTTSTAEFTNVDLPLSSDTLTISDEITPGSYATYKIRIHDPRQSGIDNFKIDDQEVSLTRSGNYYESEEFICTIDGERLDVEGIPEKVIYLGSESPMGEYNPVWPFKSDPKPLPGPNGSRVVADLIDKTVKDMEASGWSGADDGSFGREVHRRVGNKLSNKSGWLVDAYVENGTNRILSVGTSPGGSGYTQVDLLHLKSGYKPKVDDILDSSKIENLFEIKTSLSGSIDRSSGGQLERLKNVNGGRRIVLSKSPKRWTIGGGWQNNKRFGAGFKLLSLVGIGTSVYAILNFDDQDEQLDELIAEGKRINGISDPDWKKAETIVWMGQVRNWLSQFFPDSTVVDLVIVGVIYTKVLPGEEFQTE